MMNTTTQTTDVAIIGGGLAGLSAAGYLARAGYAVTLFEKAADVGGRAASQNIDGFHFNRGIHALYSGGATEQVLKDLNVSYIAHVPQKVFALKQGKLHVAPTSLSTLFRTTLFGLGDKLETLRVFATLPKIDPAELRNVSVQEWIDRNVRSADAKQYLTAFARTFVYSDSLDLVSADMFIDKAQRSFKHPVLYIDGGWQVLVDGLRKTAQAAGARIVSGSRVGAVEYADGQVQAVRLRGGELIEAAAVIIATAPRDAVKLIDDGQYAPLRKIVDGLIPAQVAALDVALSRLPDVDHPVVQDVERARFQTVQSVYARVAPAGAALVSTFKQLDPRHSSDPHEDERDLENLLDTTQPGWRELEIKRQFLPRIDAVGALPTAVTGGMVGRPGPNIPGIANLYLAGDWIGPDAFLADPALSSARQVTRLIGESVKVGQQRRAITA